MRKVHKLLCLGLILLCLTLPALAEGPAVPEEMLGEWIPTMTIYKEAPFIGYLGYGLLHITADGFFTYDYEDAPCLPVLHYSATGAWYIKNTEGETLTLMTDAHGQLIAYHADGALLFCRPDAPEPELPPIRTYNAIGGDWQARALYVSHSYTSDDFSCIVDFEALGLPTPVITLPAFASYDAIAAAWQSAACQAGSESVMSWLQDIYGYELINSDTLILVSSYGLIALDRIAVPEVDADLAAHAAPLAGYWRLDAFSVGGITLEPAAFGEMNVDFTIDEQGYTLMFGDVVPLQLIDGNVCVGGYPVCLLDAETLVMTLADGVEARFITEAAWYRRQIVGTWQISKVRIPAVGLDEQFSATLDMQLIIQPDGTVILRNAGSETTYALESTDDVIDYLLVGPETHTLTISSLSTLRLSNDSETYTLWFKPAK